ncbi:MAG: hypothetical protein Q9214_004372, partial [Letrouitia sp. 1 TL-2023]
RLLDVASLILYPIPTLLPPLQHICVPVFGRSHKNLVIILHTLALDVFPKLQHGYVTARRRRARYGFFMPGGDPRSHPPFQRPNVAVLRRENEGLADLEPQWGGIIGEHAVAQLPRMVSLVVVAAVDNHVSVLGMRVSVIEVVTIRATPPLEDMDEPGFGGQVEGVGVVLFCPEGRRRIPPVKDSNLSKNTRSFSRQAGMAKMRPEKALVVLLESQYSAFNMRPGSQEPSRETSNSPPPHRRSCSDIPKISPTAPQSYPWHSDSRERATQGSSPFSPPAEYSSDPLSPSATDRVFPIRSVISVDPNSTPAARTDQTGDGFPGMSLESSGTAQFVAGPRSRSLQSRQHSASGTTSVDDTASDISNTDSNPINQIETLSSTTAPGRRSTTLGGRARPSPGPPSAGKERMGGARQMSTFLDTHSVRSESQASGPRSVADSAKSLPDETGALVTARFKHVVTEEGHAVIIGRDGDTLQRCEDEPIHIPGAVQSFGLLIAIKEDDEGKFKVRVVSENSKKIIGYTPKQLFALDNFCDIFSDEQADNLLDHVDFIRDDDAEPATNGPEVFTLAIRTPASRKMQKLWCAMHLSPGNGDLIICEFELEDDQINPLVPTDNATPEPPENTLHGNPTEAEYAESTVNLSKPLRVLRSARKRKGEAAAMEVFNIMSQVQEQLANAPNLEVFLKVLVGVVKEVTGFHRVMIYQFDQAFNGKVVTELVDPRATKDLYKGLNFPASDIPKQARDLYKVNK